MKKIILLVLAFMMLSGCGQKKDDFTVMAPVNELYALYDEDGEQLTKDLYKTYKEYDFGYIVTNIEDQIAFINTDGDMLVPYGEYASLEAVDDMLYATKTVDPTTTPAPAVNGYIYQNLYILDSQGEVLYTASETVGIKKSGLPIVLENNEYKVLYGNGEVLETSANEILFVSQYNDGDQIVLSYKDHSDYYDFSLGEDVLKATYEGAGSYRILAVGDAKEYGAILYDSTLKNLVYVNRENFMTASLKVTITHAYFDNSHNIILKNGNITMLYSPSKNPIVMNAYYLDANNYLVRNNQVYGPHNIYKDGVVLGRLENCQLYPDDYHISSSIFPVYVRNEGYQFYNFENKKVLESSYDDAEPFDINSRAIVKTKESKGYSLIDNTGKVLTTEFFSSIKHLGDTYYAVYNAQGVYGVIDKDGKVLFPVEYTDLPEDVLFTYNGTHYMMLEKNGRNYVYDLDDEMNVVFSIEGKTIFDERGCFIVEGRNYYNFDGEKIN